MVFVATRGDVAGTFLAVARVDAVMRALATAHPWLRDARLQAEADHLGRLPVSAPPIDPDATGFDGPADVDEWWAGVRAGSIWADPLQVAQQFLQRVQWQQPAGHGDPNGEWLRLPGLPATWEHAAWLRPSDLTDGLVRDTVEPESFVVDDWLWTTNERVRAVAAAPGEFVALLNPSRRFDRLVDRESLLIALGESWSALKDAG